MTQSYRGQRILDLCGALTLCVPMVCAGLILLCLNPGFNPGPLLFRQTRIGLHGRPFTLWKFRTLNRAGQGTRLGVWLRRTRLDELPQALMILRGQMALVGPRALERGEYDLFTHHIPGFAARQRVRPGLTGLAQVRQGHTTGVPAAREKLTWDLQAMRAPSLWQDLSVIALTCGVVLIAAPTATKPPKPSIRPAITLRFP